MPKILPLGRNSISEIYEQSLPLQNLRIALSNISQKIFLKGLVGSAFSYFIAEVFKAAKHPFLLVFNNKEEAAFFLNDLEFLLTDHPVLFYPGSYRRPYEVEEIDNANVLLRAEVLTRLNSQKKAPLIVSYPDALFEKVMSKKELSSSTVKISVGDNLGLDFINEVLFEYQFKRVDFVTEPGDFSVRGGIVDVFSFSHAEPYRIEFFGDEVESIRSFDVETQLSNSVIRKLQIVPNVAHKINGETRQSIIEFLPKETKIFVADLALVSDTLENFFLKAEDRFTQLNTDIKYSAPAQLFLTATELKKQLQQRTVVEFGGHFYFDNNTAQQFNFDCSPQPSFNKQFKILIESLNHYHAKGYKTLISCANNKQAQRFHDIFEDSDVSVAYETQVLSLHAGFVDHQNKIVCYTDHQIFERYHRFNLKNGYAKKQAISLRELTSLEVGDYVTHIDHGIGKFGGLQKIDVDGQMQEAIKLFYGERDILYLSIHSLHKITKFNGKDGKPPKVYKLGSKAWKTLKQKTKSRVKEIAFNLIQLYAKRKLKTGYQYTPDSAMQLELEASFLYEDTPDQMTATADIKADMESTQPMDRLVCGDVGFGKTEVAIRAAFKAVDNGKQVAVLVPTTILAFQHAKTFKSRLKDFPVTIDYINRFRTLKEKKEIKAQLESGQLDVIIGTHQLVNKTFKFKDLGLLIVDEEQKFGVAVKEKLKSIKENVDVLTLTATPIPRTLQFSLMAARDLSVINTPPPNRYPIESHVIRLSETIIRDAVQYELQRSGQVFFIHNRIENIKEVAGMLQRLVPDAKIGVGHGQMEGKKLEQLMLNFMNGEFDILVSTTIVESGLDVPNANTIFINNANNFGLSDLHQMRGRVGRSNKKAFCYFITPEYSVMTNDARKRITALEQYTALGSGFNIAMKDLEIRGAGDLLGGEQSGFINDIGFETYQKILNEAIEELKEKEFKDLYKEDKQTKTYVKDITIDTDFSLLFPDDYVKNISERLNLYTQLNKLSSEKELEIFESNLIDRFGPIPSQVEDLFDSVRLKWIAMQIGIEKIIMKQNKLVGYFLKDQESSFYQSKAFGMVLRYVQNHPRVCQLKEKNTRQGLRLILSFDHVGSAREALEFLSPVGNV